MSSTFTPNNTFKDVPEKEWPAKLGVLDWDKTNIVFTKRSFIEFLRYAGISLDPNFHNIAKLPRYAEIGRMEGGASEASGIAQAAPEIAQTSAPYNTSADDFKPSRRVRTAPGGNQTFRLGNDEDDDPFNSNPKLGQHVQPLPVETKAPVPAQANTNDFKPSRRVRTVPGGAQTFSFEADEDEVEVPTKKVESLSVAEEKAPEPVQETKSAEAEEAQNPNSNFKPSRRVRHAPGGPSSMASLWDDNPEPEQFKPTRRVREGPGGNDSISQIF